MAPAANIKDHQSDNVDDAFSNTASDDSAKIVSDSRASCEVEFGFGGGGGRAYPADQKLSSTMEKSSSVRAVTMDGKDETRISLLVRSLVRKAPPVSRSVIKLSDS